MKELDEIIVFINNKKNIIDNIFYKYSILKNYSPDFYKELSKKFINNINSKDNNISNYAVKLKNKLILEKEEERLLNLIVKYFKFDNIKKIIKTKKIIKKIDNEEPTISIKNSHCKSDNSSNISLSKSSSTKSLSSKSSSSNLSSSSNSIYTISSCSFSTSNSNKKNHKKKINNNKIFISKNDLTNDFGKKVKHYKKSSNKNNTKNKKSKKEKKNYNFDLNSLTINNNLNENINFNGIKIKNTGIIKI